MTAEEPWKIAIVDDDKDVHAVSGLVLSGFRFKDRPLQIFNEFSAAGARRLLSEEPGIAVILLDVVMETDHAGLDVVKFIREELDNGLIRIILRTGQPGQAPEGRVIAEYDINDYKEKSDLSAQKLITSVTAALRGYDDLLTIQSLASSNEVLERMVQERAGELSASNKTLHRHKKLLDEAQKIASIGNYEWNLVSGEMEWSDQIYRILRVPAEKVVPSLEALLEGILVEDYSRVNSAIRSALKTHQPYNVEHSDRKSVV
jgi:response regulator RpfG family c-di-GMP phosphodiesterase